MKESKEQFMARVRAKHPERFLNKEEHKARTLSINKALAKHKELSKEEIVKHNQGGFYKYGKFHHNRAYND
jgi:hypothetical protein